MHKITFEKQPLRATGIRIIQEPKYGIPMGNFQDGVYSFQEQLQEAYNWEKAYREARKIDPPAKAKILLLHKSRYF